MLEKWNKLIFWAQCQNQKPRWAIVPDVVGNKDLTLCRYEEYVTHLLDAKIPVALAVQDGMTVQDVRDLSVEPEVIAIGGSDEFKWKTVKQWCDAFPRVHVLRCNMPDKLYELEAMGVESCDGTGWNRGDKAQSVGLEKWAYSMANPTTIFPSEYLGCHTKKSEKKQEELFK